MSSNSAHVFLMHVHFKPGHKSFWYNCILCCPNINLKRIHKLLEIYSHYKLFFHKCNPAFSR